MPATGKPAAQPAQKSGASHVGAVLRNALALVGLLATLAASTWMAWPAGRETMHGWLVVRAGQAQGAQGAQGAQAGAARPEADGDAAVPDARPAAAAPDLQSLPQGQAEVARWLGKKYRVAPQALAALVQEAWRLGTLHDIDPTLILAVMAIESGFNPFAQSAAGAQGLMQVMTRIHADKYADFGGHGAAFDPISNLHVGVHVLRECIARAGSVSGGLRHYVGAANMDGDGGYTAKVLAEHRRLRAVAGRSTPFLTATAQDRHPA